MSDVKFSPKETIVTVNRKPVSEENEKNPYILIGLDKIEGNLIVQDESGDRFEEPIISNKAGVQLNRRLFFISMFHADQSQISSPLLCQSRCILLARRPEK